MIGTREKDAFLDGLTYVSAARQCVDVPPLESDPDLLLTMVAIIAAELADEVDRMGGSSAAVLDRIYTGATREA
jgi:hypothetical protein